MSIIRASAQRRLSQWFSASTRQNTPTNFYSTSFWTKVTKYNPRMGETGFFWCEHIVTSPKNVKTLHEQIIADIY